MGAIFGLFIIVIALLAIFMLQGDDESIEYIEEDREFQKIFESNKKHNIIKVENGVGSLQLLS